MCCSMEQAGKVTLKGDVSRVHCGAGPQPQVQGEGERDGTGGDAAATCGTPRLQGDSPKMGNKSPWGGGRSGRQAHLRT